MDKTPVRNNTDDIEISQLFSWFGRGFSRLGRSTISGLASLRNVFFKNRLFFIITIAVAMILGAIYSELIKKKYYKSTMVLSCVYLNTQILKNSIEKLNLLCGDEEREGLAEELNLSPELAKKIAGFEFATFVSEDKVIEIELLREQLNNVAAEKQDLVDKVIKTLQIENKDAYQITVLLYDPTVVKDIETKIIQYFNSNPYISRRIEINKISLVARKKKILEESARLDSLKAIVYRNYQTLGKSSRGSNNVILGEEGFVNPLDVFTADLSLNNELLSIERNLFLQPDFEVVDEFTTIKQPESVSLPLVLLTSLIAGIVVGYLVIGLVAFDNLLANYPTKK